MKILHAITAPGSGGAEVLVLDMVEKLVEQGHEVLVVFLEDRGHDFEKYYLGKLESLGVSYSFLGRVARKNPFKGVLGFRRIIKSFKPDVVHCHNYYFSVFSLFSFCKTPSFVYTHHNIELSKSLILYKFLDKKIDAYIGICQTCYVKLCGVASNPVVRVDNGASFERVASSFDDASPKGNKRKVNITYVGRLFDKKNVHLLVSAFAKVKLTHPGLQAELHIVGDGPQRKMLESLCEKKGVEQDVYFHGRVSDVPVYLAAADIFALSSISEGLPISLIEASLFGLPTISTNVGGCSEVSHEVGNGVVVDSLDVDEYARKLSRLVVDIEYRDALANNARKYSGHYSIERVVREHLSLYSRLTNSVQLEKSNF